MTLFALGAFAAAAYFAAMAGRQPRPAVIAAAILWLLYGVYEILIGSGVLCDANCNIRVDLLLIWPVLLVTTLLARTTPAPWKTAGIILGVVVLILTVQAVVIFGYVMVFDPPEAPPSVRGSQPSPK